MLEDKSIKQIHFMGIGGIGVSALAEMLLRHGYCVTGSDLQCNANVNRLKQLGAKVVLGHAADNLGDADLAVYSSAITGDNPERSAAERAGIPVLSRGELLAQVMQLYSGVAVCGTHGKTTTTALISDILMQSHIDPSFAIGGVLNNQASPVRVGESPYFIAEADESDASFLFMNPHIVVVTNIDVDHLESYDNNFETLKQAFVGFLNKLPDTGMAILCGDDPVIRALLPQLTCRVVTYGFNTGVDIRATEFKQSGFSASFSVLGKKTAALLNLPGRHNVLNALAAIVVAENLGVRDEVVWKALEHFPGVGRRFHSHGEWLLEAGRALMIEDYGHHPSEVAATLAAARLVWPNRRLVLVFQPHRYSRTHDLWDAFVDVLNKPDVLVLTEIYSASEEPIVGVSGQSLCESVEKSGKLTPVFVPLLDELPVVLRDIVQADDVLIFQGAGSIGALAKQLGSQ